MVRRGPGGRALSRRPEAGGQRALGKHRQSLAPGAGSGTPAALGGLHILEPEPGRADRPLGAELREQLGRLVAWSRRNLRETITLAWGPPGAWGAAQRVVKPGGARSRWAAASRHGSFSKGPATKGVLFRPPSCSSRGTHACSVHGGCSGNAATGLPGDRVSNPFPVCGGHLCRATSHSPFSLWGWAARAKEVRDCGKFLDPQTAFSFLTNELPNRPE